MKRIFLLFGLFLFVVAFPLFFQFRGIIRDYVEEMKKADLPVALKASEVSLLTVSKTVNLDVPFSPQAPFANWALPYQEACEEASALLVHEFYENKNLTPEIADVEILKIVEWEKNHFGFYEHTTAEQTAELLKKYFGYEKVEVKYDPTVEDIKKELIAGRPVIAPFAGRKLGNPYYKNPGPVYHMLIIKGFLKDGRFITNDVGTKRGRDFLYSPEVLLNAIHDAPESGSVWKNEKPEDYILTGRKAIIVVWPNAGISGKEEAPSQ